MTFLLAMGRSPSSCSWLPWVALSREQLLLGLGEQGLNALSAGSSQPQPLDAEPVCSCSAPARLRGHLGGDRDTVSGDELVLGEPCQVWLSLIPRGDAALTADSWVVLVSLLLPGELRGA